MNSRARIRPPLSRAEFEEYITFHAQQLTAEDVRKFAQRLPELRPGFSQISTAEFPHTSIRVEFLARVVEKFAAGQTEGLPFDAISEAAFALTYLEQESDVIPDILPDIGYTDDAIIVALVLERHASIFRGFAKQVDFDPAELLVS